MPPGVSLISRLPLNLQVKHLFYRERPTSFWLPKDCSINSFKHNLSLAMSIIRLSKDGYNLLQQIASLSLGAAPTYPLKHLF